MDIMLLKVIKTSVTFIHPSSIQCILHYLIRKLIITSSNVIFNKRAQSVAYMDDINIMVRTLTTAQETFTKLETNAQHIGLKKINYGKTKMIIQLRKLSCLNNIRMGNYNPEVVDNFIYMGGQYYEGSFRRTRNKEKNLVGQHSLFCPAVNMIN